MISLEDALAAYARELRALPRETLATSQSLGRVLAQAAVARTDLPRFDQSAMDGYALRSADVADAGSARPVRLPVTTTVAAAAHGGLPVLPPRSAARIFTGAAIPPGADAVVAQERVRRDGDCIEIDHPVTPGRNIRFRGEELAEGATLAHAGQRITPGLLASLINAGVETVTAARRPRIQVLVSGDEVRPAGTPLAPGEIPDSNGPMIEAILTRWGYALASPPRHVRDDAATVREALKDALQEADLVLTTGGASVGDRDYLPATAEALGVRRVFWKVAQKPGKPMFFGVRNGTALLALPGNPVATLVGIAVHARTVLDLLEGRTTPGPAWNFARLADAVARDTSRTRLLRMALAFDTGGTAHLHALPHQDSHMLGNLARSDALAWIPVGEGELAIGTPIRWTPLPQ